LALGFRAASRHSMGKMCAVPSTESQIMCKSFDVNRVAGVSVLAVATVFSGVLLSGGSNAWAEQNAGDIARQIVGTWSVESVYVERDGKRIERFSSHPQGIAIYDPNGRFASIIMRPNLPRFAAKSPMKGTADENKAIVQGSTAFYGKWSVDGKEHTLRVHVDGSSYPNWDGQDQKKTVSVSADRLKLCVAGQIGGTACAIYKRLN